MQLRQIRHAATPVRDASWGRRPGSGDVQRQLHDPLSGPWNRSSDSAGTEPLTAVVDRNAEGAASSDLGPGQLNLLTGDFKITGTEEEYFGLTASRTASSRQPTAGGSQEGQAPIFGKEWVSGTVAELSETGYTHIRKTSGTSLDVVLDDGSPSFPSLCCPPASRC